MFRTAGADLLRTCFIQGFRSTLSFVFKTFYHYPAPWDKIGTWMEADMSVVCARSAGTGGMAFEPTRYDFELLTYFLMNKAVVWYTDLFNQIRFHS